MSPQHLDTTAMQVQLITADKNSREKAISVNVPAFLIGRAEGCHLRSNSTRISPQHCAIYTQDGRVTVQDLGSETGTFVNGKRIAAKQGLNDGDEFVVGSHSFVVTIKAAEGLPTTIQNETFTVSGDSMTHPSAEPEQDAEIMFEIRHKGQNVSVTKQRLFDMALKGAVSPDDIITVAGTKVFADSIHGIVFGNESDTTAAPMVSATQSPAAYTTAPVAAAYDSLPSAVSSGSESSIPSDSSPQPNASAPFDITNEPSAKVDRVPGARKEVTFTDLGKSLTEPLNQASPWMGNYINRRHLVIAGSVLAGLCLLGVLVFLLLPDSKSAYGAVRIAGTLTLDGKPVAGANVTLHPRCEDSLEAGGLTDKNGRFTVTTGNDPIGRGAVPGEYDVTFSLRSTIPREYERIATSGLSPITVEAGGWNRFPFELTSAGHPSPPMSATPGPPIAETVSSTVSAPLPPPDPDPLPEEPAPPSPPVPFQSALPDIWAAVERGTVQDVQFFWAQGGVNVNAKNNAGNTPLHLAAARNDADAARVLDFLLIWGGADVNAANNAGNTPLHVVAGGNANVNVVNFLLSRRAAVNQKNNVGDTPLHLAARDNANVNVVDSLIRGGAESYAQNNAGQIPQDVASTEAKKRRLLEALPRPPRDIQHIFDAAARGTVRDVDYFVRHDAEKINERNHSGNTPLHIAARSNSDADVLRYLIDRGANVNAENLDGRTPWDLADGAAKGSILFQAGGRRGRGR